MEKEKISVIVPVYMVEDFLPFCIESIQKQTYENIEIILVDDGSTDKCGELCDRYELVDSRIVTIHKQNGGLSDARNVGIQNATGSFIACVDSDDFIAPDMIENLYNCYIATNADIVICGMKKTSDQVIKSEKKDNDLQWTTFDSDEAIERSLYSNDFSVSAAGKLYKRMLFDNIKYPIGMYYEDLFTTYRLFKECKKIAFFPCVEYFYYNRSNSIVNAVYSEKHLQCFEALNKMYEDGVFHTKQLNKAYDNAFIEAYCELLEKKPPLDDPKIKKIWTSVKSKRLSVVTNKKSTLRVRIKALLLFLGPKISQKIIIEYYKKKWNLKT